MSLLQSVVLVLVLLQLGETHQAEQEGGERPGIVVLGDSGVKEVQLVSKVEFEKLHHEVEELKRELDHWQNTTIHILTKYLPGTDECSGSTDLQEVVDRVNTATTNHSREVLSQYLSAVTTLQEKVEASHNHSREVTQLLSQYLDAITRLEEKVDRVEEASTNHIREVSQTLAHLDQQLATLLSSRTDGLFQSSPALSCNNLTVGSPSGRYWILSTRNRAATLEYCDMTRECCGSRGGWMRVAHLDMTDPDQQCPSGFRNITSPRRMCGRPGRECVSTIFPVRGVEYRKVCGKVIGYQYYEPEAFHTGTDSIDSHYVHGVSITHGQSPRQHIWTFAVAEDETTSDSFRCPCTRPDLTYAGSFDIPSFVGQDYFCETGSRSGSQQRYYTEDPLWDGTGCGSSSTCCSFNNPPWFCRELPQPTTDDIELRLCANIGPDNEDSPIELVELYVQ